MNKPGPSSKQEPNKTLAVMLCLFLLFMYKQMVWDPYFHHSLAGAGGAQPSPTATPASHDPYAEPPSEQFADAAARQQASPATPSASAPGVAPAPDAPVLAAAPQQYPADAEVAASSRVVVETGKLRVTIAALGGRLTDYQLLDYAAQVGVNAPRLNVVDHVEHAPYPLGVYSGGVDDSRTLYTAQVTPDSLRPVGDAPVRISGDQSVSVVLQGSLPDGRGVTKTLTFLGNGYFVDIDVRLSAPPADSSRLGVEWTRLLGKDSPTLLDRAGTGGFVWFDGQKALREQFSHLHADHFDLPDLQWLALADHYFVATLISETGAAMGRVLKTGELYRARLYGEPTEKRLRLFVAPKSYRLLESAGFELRRVIDIGYTGVLSVPLMSVLHVLHDVFHNYGLAIVMLTVIIKLLMYPLTASSFRQMKSMQELAPEMTKIKESVADKQQQQAAIMNLYKDRGVNPLGGCFPMLVQIPVFIALFSALSMDIELRHAPFALWVHDLSAPEKAPFFGFGVPVMAILFIISMLVQQWQMPSTVDPAQKKVMMIMPIVFGYFFANSAAGLTLYYLTNNFISIGQQAGFRREGTGHALRLTLIIAVGVFALCSLLVWISKPV